MRRRAVLAGAALAIASAGWASSAAAAPHSLAAIRKATTTCNTAIRQDKVVGAKVIAACGVIAILGKHACNDGQVVSYITADSGATALLLKGHRPEVYSEQNFYDSSLMKLCGDPIDPGLTPPLAAMTKAEVRSAWR